MFIIELEFAVEEVLTILCGFVEGRNKNCVDIIKKDGNISVTIINIKLNIISGSLSDT